MQAVGYRGRRRRIVAGRNRFRRPALVCRSPTGRPCHLVRIRRERGRSGPERSRHGGWHARGREQLVHRELGRPTRPVNAGSWLQGEEVLLSRLPWSLYLYLSIVDIPRRKGEISRYCAGLCGHQLDSLQVCFSGMRRDLYQTLERGVNGVASRLESQGRMSLAPEDFTPRIGSGSASRPDTPADNLSHRCAPARQADAAECPHGDGGSIE